MARTFNWLAVALAVAIGVAAGIGGYTFRYARGLSYLSTDPAACVNCHIMQPQYDAWQKASHHGVAVCVDCHLPQDLIGKYAVKTENGWRHGKLFTTQNFVEPIRVAPAGMRVLQQNCVRCHEPMVEALGPGHELAEVQCVKCHVGVGHGERTGLGGPLREAKLHTPAVQPRSAAAKRRLAEGDLR